MFDLNPAVENGACLGTSLCSGTLEDVQAQFVQRCLKSQVQVKQQQKTPSSFWEQSESEAAVTNTTLQINDVVQGVAQGGITVTPREPHCGLDKTPAAKSECGLDRGK